MPKSISASVGQHAPNIESDVRVIQELLNNVPLTALGPVRDLDVDGVYGPLTRAAIIDFQKFHFGLQAADGRVDPGRPTITKLNEFEAVPAQTSSEPLSDKFIIQHHKAIEVISGRDDDFFFKVIDVTNNRQAIYYFTAFTKDVPPAPSRFDGKFTMFTTRKPTSVASMQCAAGYTTTDDNGVLKSTLNLPLDGGAVQVAMHLHLMASKNGPGRATTGQSGLLKLVKIL